MSIKDGRALYAKRHKKYDNENLPPADSVVQRALLRSQAARGDELAAEALKQWKAKQPKTEQ